MLEKIKGTEVLNENVTIIISDTGKAIKLFNSLEPDYENKTMKGITLNDCLEIAKKNGFKNGTITVLSESYLQGEIYRYNNYNDKEWNIIGNLAGFA